ncbi:MAG: glycerol-3-phosphate 1-O-acyltransferase [Alphaproteobacteria bacterium]|nr:MAG: glycerol-3-phosphate 1-O-acyltransferase [Alphaproteobacteria bacterium]TAF13544.1 MAG: glycerol-3-phosphate 1-O-acyltransferase [Alphaproteobacteria bacterium]TAF40380.1 MAG: glycerol-3-phosphate 1-O-acyltransferase [Alphaproteobacteria bacterium]TAF77517.1 MAG: glycerol-3-phosphate 1-O-acyltransferase [Alphaproteobacteria bacterium]
MMLLFAVLIAYFVGSLPMGVIVAKCAKLPDPRTKGSGNIGATNMVRTAGKKWGALTLLLDALKGIVAVIIGMSLAETDGYLIGVVAVLGHCYPVWLRFRGGKGVATALAVIGTTHAGYMVDGWWIIPALTASWIGIFYATRLVSLASLCTFALSAVLNIIFYDQWILPLLLTFLIFMRHRDNISRLIQGTEHGFKSSRTNAASTTQSTDG